MATVSVAMAAYNGEQYIKEQIHSIVEQLGSNDELVISYDVSTDNTLAIIEELSRQYPQIKVVHDKGAGVFSNFENAIMNCQGDYVFISDQDDIWEGTKISHVTQLFESNDVDMIIHNGVHIDKDSNIISNDFFSEYGIRKGVVRNFLKPRYSGCCTAFNQKMREMILPIPREVGAYDHWIGMVGEIYGRVLFDPEILIRHRIHDDNVTVSTRGLPEIIHSRRNIFIELVKLRRKVLNSNR